MTIASVCHAIYKSEFLLENTIGVCDESRVDTYSVKYTAMSISMEIFSIHCRMVSSTRRETKRHTQWPENYTIGG